ncbi:Acg family FMN-binding oxidoreductase [Streptosporangium saharense]|uniref:Nitroreductase n=1 Tax=Streptosporangium saharense TaxID=1706840 RepID=A0A7W7VQI6_9ACTN|nr:nitroreductase family protein [Streptosporangium saharense]MBB4919062.1 nitroreductase [Streptosporangium saharense]
MNPFATPAGLHRVVVAASAAPSVHNTQPWRFHRVSGDTLEMYADLSRLLPVIDPLGRALGISCGAALFNLRLAVRMVGHEARITPLPALDERPDLLATIHTTPGAPTSTGESLLYDMIRRRRTNRFPFDGRSLPADVVVDLVDAAHEEGATLVVLTGRAARRVLDLVAAADATVAGEEDYDAELARWTHLGSRDDGVPLYAIGPRPRHRGLPIRDFAPEWPGRPGADFEQNPQIAALFTDGDGAHDWLRAGQALQRVLLTATAHGVSASPFSQPLDLRGPECPGSLDDAPLGCPQMFLRLGYGQPVPHTPRRPVSEVLRGV